VIEVLAKIKAATLHSCMHPSLTHSLRAVPLLPLDGWGSRYDPSTFFAGLVAGHRPVSRPRGNCWLFYRWGSNINQCHDGMNLCSISPAHSSHCKGLMQMFVGNEQKVYILDKAEGNAAQINGHPAWGAVWYAPLLSECTTPVNQTS
jgi:hypothetical protein